MDHFKKVAIEEAHVDKLFVDGMEVHGDGASTTGLLVPEDSEAATVRQMREDFNALLAILRELRKE